jgi:peptidyl-prolyl cis-trans isomerase SurA
MFTFTPIDRTSTNVKTKEMKKLIGILTLAILTCSAQAQQKRAIIDKVIATVGSELVLLSDVEDQYSLSRAQEGQLPPDARCNILNSLLASKLLLNQAQLDSIEVTDEEVEAQLDARIERILGFMNNDVNQFEDYYGQSINDVKEQFREDLRNQILVERMRNQILNSVKVTPSEVKDFFYSIPNDSLPYFNAEVEIGEIVYKPKVNEQEKQAAIDKLENIRRQIINGEATFEEMAMKFSDDGSARNGGDLGWAKRGKFVPEFEAAAYKLDKDEVSPVVETEFGFHLIQMLERRGNSIHLRHILIKPEITDADLDKARAHLDSVRTLIMEDSLDFSVAVKRFSNEDMQSFNNDGRMINPTTGNTFFEIGDLDPDIYFTIDTMNVGDISRPFEFTGRTGETLFRIVQLQSRTTPHRANLQQDYSKIQQAAIEAKKSDYINQWVQETVDATYIDIDPMYDGCPQLERWKVKDVRP